MKTNHLFASAAVAVLFAFTAPAHAQILGGGAHGGLGGTLGGTTQVTAVNGVGRNLAVVVDQGVKENKFKG